MKNITAVNWIKNKIEEYGDPENLIISWEDFDDLINQAKQMEKEQIVHAFGVGCHVESKRLIGYHGMAEQYYNETFGKL